MDLKRYEEAADSLSKAIDKAPATKQAGLRDLRKRCVMAEAGVVAPASGVNQSPAPAQTTTQAEVVLWKSIENSRSQSDFQSYINQYPSGAFVGLAHTHLDQLEAEDKALREQQAAQAAAELERQNVEAQRAYAAGVSYKDSEHHDAVVTASPSGFSLKPSNGRGEIDAPCSDVEWQAEPSSAIVSLRVRIRSTGVKLTLVPYAVENKDFVFYSHQFADALTKYCGSQGERVKLR
jgi:hypothetical protein